MPKKFVGENSKAAAAKARKELAKTDNQAIKEQEEEDAKWLDVDKNIEKRQRKKDEQAKKRQEQLQKKAEAKAMLENEIDSIRKTITPQKLLKDIPPKKTTCKKEVKTHLEVPVEENVNRMQVDELEARSVAEAIEILSIGDESVDRHPEKRLKAKFSAFEERRLRELKVEYPGLRQSQIKQMVFKEWRKSPENPLNNM